MTGKKGKNSGRHSLIEPDFAALESWPTPDPDGLGLEKREIFRNRVSAVNMYARKVPMKEIMRITGLAPKEVRRIVQRCVSPNGVGMIAGFYGCVPDYRVKEYRRSVPPDFVPETQVGGRSGALGALFRAHPEAERQLQAMFLKRPSAGDFFEAKISVRELHVAFLGHLRELGVKNYHWPFNTASEGYEAIRRYCKWLETEFADENFSARHSEKGKHKRKIGRGFHAMFAAFRPLTYLELDYNLVDAASIIVIKNSFGVEMDLVLPRWYFGLVTDVFSRLVTGVFIAFESNPSSDCFLETIQSAIFPAIYVDTDPRSKYLVDASILSENVIPELAYQAFAVIKVDNAWANASIEAINLLMDLTGCAVNFGPAGEWSRRPVVENVFGNLAQKGLKRYPSTYGSSPLDSTRNNPEEQAKAFKIRASDLVSTITNAVKNHNNAISGGKEYSSPMEIIKASIENSDSGFISQQLSKAAIRSRKFEYRRFQRNVRGYPDKGIRAFVSLDGCVYTNTALSARDDLIGKAVLIFVNRRDVRDAYCVVIGTGEPLGELEIETNWSHDPVSIRQRQYINKAGNRRRNKSRSQPARNWYEETAEDLIATVDRSGVSLPGPHKNIQKSESKVSKVSKVSKADVLALARAAMLPIKDLAPTRNAVEVTPPLPQTDRATRRAFSFDEDISLNPIRRKNI